MAWLILGMRILKEWRHVAAVGVGCCLTLEKISEHIATIMPLSVRQRDPTVPKPNTPSKSKRRLGKAHWFQEIWGWLSHLKHRGSPSYSRASAALPSASAQSSPRLKAPHLRVKTHWACGNSPPFLKRRWYIYIYTYIYEYNIIYI